MKRVDDPAAAPAGGVFAIGNFDGLHRGHRALLARAIERARARGAPSGALTFTPHPAKVLAPAFAPQLILTYEEKAAAIAATGVDVLVELPFTPALAATTPRAFVDDVLVGALRTGGVVVGDNFTFGHKAAGTVADLQALLGPRGVSVDVVAPVKVGDLVSSSTKIRELVLEGRVEAAATMLGRPYHVEGVVVRGDGRGRTIGVPTANVQSERELLPKLGVYATRARLPDGRVVDSVTNVGLRPTFSGEGVRIEAHLFDFDDDLYGRTVALDFVERLRDERRFPSVEALRAQIADDAVAARAALARSGRAGS